MQLQTFRGAFRRAQVFLLAKLGRPVSGTSDLSPNGTGNPKRSGTKRLPSNQEIQEAMHDYNYPDLTLLGPEISLPPPPDISTLPNRHPKRKQALRNGKRSSDYPMGKRSFSVPGINDRSQQVQLPRKRTNVSMKARLFERKDSDSESEEYLYPKPSPKLIQKRFIPPNSKPALASKPTPRKTEPVSVKPNAAISANRSDNVRGYLSSSNSPKPFEFPNATPRPWKPSAQKQISTINSPPEYVDMGTPENIPVVSKTDQSVANVKLRPIGKVVGSKASGSEESEVKHMTTDKLFHELSVVELVACLEKCGLKEMAEVCQTEKLDGSFISQLSPEELQELNLSPIQVMKLNKVKSGWRPKTSQFS